MSAMTVPEQPRSAADHQLAAQLQRARHVLELDDDELNLNFVYLLAGAGVDADLLDALDQARPTRRRSATSSF